MVVDELRKIGFASMGDYMKSTPEGDPYLDFSTLTPDQKAVIGGADDLVGNRVEGRPRLLEGKLHRAGPFHAKVATKAAAMLVPTTSKPWLRSTRIWR